MAELGLDEDQAHQMMAEMWDAYCGDPLRARYVAAAPPPRVANRNLKLPGGGPRGKGKGGGGGGSKCHHLLARGGRGQAGFGGFWATEGGGAGGGRTKSSSPVPKGPFSTRLGVGGGRGGPDPGVSVLGEITRPLKRGGGRGGAAPRADGSEWLAVMRGGAPLPSHLAHGPQPDP